MNLLNHSSEAMTLAYLGFRPGYSTETMLDQIDFGSNAIAYNFKIIIYMV